MAESSFNFSVKNTQLHVFPKMWAQQNWICYLGPSMKTVVASLLIREDVRLAGTYTLILAVKLEYLQRMLTEQSREAIGCLNWTQLDKRPSRLTVTNLPIST